MVFGRGRGVDSSHHAKGDPEDQAVGDWFLSSGLEVGPWCWTAKLETDDGSRVIQMGRRRRGAGQGSVRILLFGLPFLFVWSGVKHLDVSSVQLPLWGCSWGSFKSLSSDAARMGRADVKPSRKEEMGNGKPPAPFLQGKVHT